ncbi:S8 family serine peptidase [Streptomyces tubbatahanensis]|uniref:S8 family serine peptidase n=1 Tax=Streptomyces tubbatahanensis TaxID=2923272 RepID=A0ABY3XXT3_9ACTN|nr:S8 family serine peptidase [Streptomyces tubbatahanensis]UNS99330.1 S8 family serine peptidase [Streptomyces tubbatahanensis]
MSDSMTFGGERPIRSVWQRSVSGAMAVGVLVALQWGAASAAAAQDVRSQQWYLSAMQAEKMWKVSTGKGITVAVVDTGVDPSTRALQGQVLPGKDFASAPGDETKDDTGHGTTMAELIAGTGKDGSLKGLAPDAKIIPYRAGLEGVKGRKKGALSHVPQAIRAAADSDAQIINMSFGGAPGTDVAKAVEYAAKKGKLMFSSAGNEADEGNLQSYPAGYPDVAGVAGTASDGKVSKFSSYGDEVTLAAPGEGLPGWCGAKRENYCKVKGTSMASAIASASAALIWSKHPDWTGNQVLRVLTKTAGLAGNEKTQSKYLGYGAVRPRLNLLEGKGDPGDPDISPLTNEKTGPSTASAKPKSSDGKNSGKDDAPGKVKVADSKSQEEGSGWLLPAGGIAAGVIVLAGCGFAVVRLRRN